MKIINELDLIEQRKKFNLKQMRQRVQLQQKNSQQHKQPRGLLALIDKNENIFLKMKKDLQDQLRVYERAFSRDHNEYIEQRDLEYFSTECDKFKEKGRDFVQKLLQIKNNCSTVIKNLPQEQRLIPGESHNSFDMFVNEQVEKSLEFKVKTVEYEHDAQRPFENLLHEFQND